MDLLRAEAQCAVELSRSIKQMAANSLSVDPRLTRDNHVTIFLAALVQVVDDAEMVDPGFGERFLKQVEKRLAFRRHQKN